MLNQKRRRTHGSFFLDKYESKREVLERQQEAERKKHEEIERQRRKAEEEQKAKTQISATAQAEILSPSEDLPILRDASNAVGLPPPPVNVTPQLDAAVNRFEDLLERALESFDLSKPEGFLDSMFGRPHHRLGKKVELSSYALALMENFEKALASAERADETIRRLNRAQQQEYVERVRLARTALEETYRLRHAAAAAARKEMVEDAEARETIARYEANIREHGLRGYPPPPPPPSPPPPTPEEEAAQKRAEARRRCKEMADLELDRVEEQASAAEQKIANAKSRCIAIYQDRNMSDGEKRIRILMTLDNYGCDCSILPPAMQQFMEELASGEVMR